MRAANLKGKEKRDTDLCLENWPWQRELILWKLSCNLPAKHGDLVESSNIGRQETESLNVQGLEVISKEHVRS